MRILFCVGDASGDLYASLLIPRIRDRQPDVQFSGLGGHMMQQSGANLLVLSNRWSSIGLLPSLRAAASPEAWGMYKQLKKSLRENPPDVFVPVDFGAVNTRLIAYATKHNVKTVYYVPRSFFTASPRKIRRLVSKNVQIVPIFEWQLNAYRNQGGQTHYFGHPLLDTLPSSPNREEVRAQLNVGRGPLVALLPGSRHMEVRDHLPIMLNAARLVRQRIPDVEFLCACAPSVRQGMINVIVKRYGNDLGIRLVTDGAAKALAASDAAILEMGTVALEAACLDVPSIAIFWTGATNRLQAHMIRRKWQREFYALPNMILGRMAMPELIIWTCSPERIATGIVNLLTNDNARLKMLHDFEEVRSSLGEPGVSDKVANLILQTANAH